MVQLLDAFTNGKRINELDPAEGELSAMQIEVMDGSGETRRMELERAVAEAGNPIAGRWWATDQATTKAGGWFGSLDALKRLPATLGLGRYLVADDRTMRKLDPVDSTRFEDGSPAALDGSMGQCMWCWSRPWYFTTWREGTREYFAISLKPIEGRKSYRIPVGGTSWLGAGVMDRTEGKLASVISEDERYRGGNGTAVADTKFAPADAPQKTMLGMAATSLSTTAFGTNARKRGDGWEANWFVAQAAVQILIMVIMGDRNTQAAFNPERDADGLMQGGFGAGVTNISSANWDKLNGYAPLVPTSVGLELGDGCGVVDYAVPAMSDAENQEDPLITFHVPVFFGLVHAGFGHLWRWVRGLTVKQEAGVKTEVFVAQSMAAAFDPNSVEGLMKVCECPQKEGYIKRISWEGLCCMPTEVGGSTTTYYPDYFYTNGATQTGLRVRAAGGSANSGTYAGAFYTHAYYTASNAYAFCSSPLCFFVDDPTIE